MSNKRSSNFSSAECDWLTTLIKKYQSVVECRKSDVNTNERKRQIWQTIENEFNSASTGEYRTGPVLRSKWENIKKRAKNKVADEKKAVKGTGGGPANEVIFTPEESTAIEILGSDRVQGCSFQYDCDAESITELMLEEEDEYTIDNPGSVECTQKGSSSGGLKKQEFDQPINHSLWKSVTPQQIRQPVTPCLSIHRSNDRAEVEKRSIDEYNLATTNASTISDVPYTRKRKRVQDKIDVWVRNKAEVAEKRSASIDAKYESEKRYALLKEEQIRQQLRFEAEKHVAEMEILQLQKEVLRQQLNK